MRLALTVLTTLTLPWMLRRKRPAYCSRGACLST